MGYTLLIVESPAKCKKIESYLGTGYKCIASFGHIRELKDGLKCINVADNYKPTFSNMSSKSRQISTMRSSINNSDDVMLATDDDREGEAIAWHICQLFKLSVTKTKRIIFHEITKSAILKAVSEPTTINMNLVNAQLARQVLDLMVGFKISPILWSQISRSTKSKLSAGRCQTPALRIVYDNYTEIKENKSDMVYNTTGYFTKLNLPFTLQKHHQSQKLIENFLEETASFDHIYSCQKPRKTTKKPPQPFTTSTLQQSANNEFRISPKETMKICQKLYEAGLITYMRTDCKTYSKEFISTAKTFITDNYGKEYINEKVDDLSQESKAQQKPKKGKKAKKDSEVQAQEAHEAIRPTDVKRKEISKDFHPRERKIYFLIWRNTVESCMKEAIYSSITSKITAPEETEYRYSTELAVFPGWKIVAGYDKENSTYQFLQTIKNGTVIPYKKVTSKVTLKNNKMHYTEAKLVQLLEQKGIGRPSTFSSLIDKIQERGYVKKQDVKGKSMECYDYELVDEELNEICNNREFGNEKNKLVIQPTGILVIEFLIKYFNELFIYEYTKGMEDQLDIISKGDKVWYTLCKECDDQVTMLTREIKNLGREKIKIDEHHTYMICKYGPVIKYENGDKTEFKSVKSDIDVDLLRSGKYKLEDILDTTKKTSNTLGNYKDSDVELKNGKFGLYVVHNKKNYSVKSLDKREDEVTLEDVIPIIEEGMKTKIKGMVRELNDNISIRNGKFGDYVFFKTERMKKPKFIPLKKFSDDYKTCEEKVIFTWLEENHNIKF